jgi:hypothetical protein
MKCEETRDDLFDRDFHLKLDQVPGVFQRIIVTKLLITKSISEC